MLRNEKWEKDSSKWEKNIIGKTYYWNWENTAKSFYVMNQIQSIIILLR